MDQQDSQIQQTLDNIGNEFAKLNCLSESLEGQLKLQQLRQEWYSAISQRQSKCLDDISEAVYDEEIRMARVIHNRNQHLDTCGISGRDIKDSDRLQTGDGSSTERRGVYLYPEEVLYQVDRCNLVLWHRNSVLSVPRCFDLLLNCGNCSLSEYVAYSHLKNQGYIVRRTIRSGQQVEKPSLYSVWKPNSAFSKRNPTEPFCIYKALEYSDYTIDVFALRPAELAQCSQFVIALVDGGEVVFIRIEDCEDDDHIQQAK
ncbi:hypothetical protein MP228_012576 [Amoeboaphelidium protococcarum]|nr:hypothetical protein MP228_012576 [Amoeboaphelidium protococcarum]